MGGKATLVDRVLEAVRQRDLTNRLGQVTCEDSGTLPVHEFWDDLGHPCPSCEAAR